MVRRFQERFIKLLPIFLIFSIGCSAGNTVSSSIKESDSSDLSVIEEIDGIKIIQTTDNGDDVVEDAKGNHITFRVEDFEIHFSVMNYKTNVTDLFPAKSELSGRCAMNSSDEESMDLVVSSSYAKDTEGSNTANLYEFITYSIANETATVQTEGLEGRLSENINPDVQSFFETDEVIPLCKELHEVVQAYRQLRKDGNYSF